MKTPFRRKKSFLQKVSPTEFSKMLDSFWGYSKTEQKITGIFLLFFSFVLTYNTGDKSMSMGYEHLLNNFFTYQILFFILVVLIPSSLFVYKFLINNQEGVSLTDKEGLRELIEEIDYEEEGLAYNSNIATFAYFYQLILFILQVFIGFVLTKLGALVYASNFILTFLTFVFYIILGIGLIASFRATGFFVRQRD